MSSMKLNCVIWSKEWVRELDDAIWRRTKQGMWLNTAQQARISEWLARNSQKPALSLAS